MPLNIEIETDLRYMQEVDPLPGFDWKYGKWPRVENIFERRLATNIRNRSGLRLDMAVFLGVIGLAAELRNQTITLDVEVCRGIVHAEVCAMERDVMPPVTSDNAGNSERAIRWFAARHLAFRLSVSSGNIFWIPII